MKNCRLWTWSLKVFSFSIFCNVPLSENKINHWISFENSMHTRNKTVIVSRFITCIRFLDVKTIQCQACFRIKCHSCAPPTITSVARRTNSGSAALHLVFVSKHGRCWKPLFQRSGGLDCLCLNSSIKFPSFSPSFSVFPPHSVGRGWGVRERLACITVNHSHTCFISLSSRAQNVNSFISNINL